MKCTWLFAFPRWPFPHYFLISPLRGQPADQRPGKSSWDAPTFVDVAASSGVDFKNEPSPTSQKYLPESMVGGVAMLDYNGGWSSRSLLCQRGRPRRPDAPGKIAEQIGTSLLEPASHRNNGDGTFSDTTESAGVAGESYGQGVGRRRLRQ